MTQEAIRVERADDAASRRGSGRGEVLDASVAKALCWVIVLPEVNAKREPLLDGGEPLYRPGDGAYDGGGRSPHDSRTA